jgi:hypothetical protein
MLELERRTLGFDLSGIGLRADQDTPVPYLEGYAAVFNREAEIFGFSEVIKPGAFDRALREGHDVRALLNHDPNQILGRTKSKTLELRVDAKGLRTTIHPPETQVGRDVVTSVRRGDLDGMSFAFRIPLNGDDWRKVDGKIIRDVLDVELVDVSVVAYPAYEATSVSLRALEHFKAAGGVANSVNALRLRYRLAGFS